MAKIEKDCPLPPHTNRDYNECYAKVVLESLYPEQFNGLVLADKPDLQSRSNNIGIEVTVAEKKETLEAENLYSQLPYTDCSEKQRKIERIRQCVAKYEDGMLFTSERNSFYLVNKAIEGKIKKLQYAGYLPFREYHLFVISSVYADDSMLQDELEFLQSIRAGDSWKKIYISAPNALYCFSFARATYERVFIDSSTQEQHGTQARQMVEEGEKNDKT